MASSDRLRVVARLSDTCASCAAVVPMLNHVRRRFGQDIDRIEFVAAVTGDTDRFVIESGLEWPLVDGFVAPPDAPRYLPHVLVVSDAGELVDVATAADLAQLEERVASLLGKDLEAAPDEIRRLVEAQLADRLSAVAPRQRILWTVRSSGDEPRVPDDDDADVRVVSSLAAARQALGAGELSSIAILEGDHTFYGDPDVAATLVTAWGAAGAATVRAHAGMETTPLTAEPIDAPAVVAAAIAAMPVARGRLHIEALWAYQRAAGELDAYRVADVMFALGALARAREEAGLQVLMS